MSAPLSRTNLDALEATAKVAAAYLDACDQGDDIRLDAEYYRACADVLARIFDLVSAEQVFSDLLKHSPAAREILEAQQIGKRIETSRIVFYPQLAALLHRVS